MKICPLMAFNADMDTFMFKNYDAPTNSLYDLKSNQLQVIKLADGGTAAVNIVRGTCKESECAWWSEERKCCGVVK